MKTGRVTSVTGRVYMLSPYEELWEKELPQVVEDLLTRDAGDVESGKATKTAHRDKTRVVTYRIPHNSAVQIGRAPSELQSLMRTSYAVFGLYKKKQHTPTN